MSHKHGGVRIAGDGKKIGRPPKEVKKVPGSYSLSPEVKAFLDERGKSAAVEVLIRKSTDFQQWISEQL